MEITKDTLIGELIREKPTAISVLMRMGMGCVGCPASQMESIAEAAMVHGMDPDELLKQIKAV